MSQYPFNEIEKKWQRIWEDNGCHKVDMKNTKKKFYNLSMFSYPSGDKLHTGHWYNYGPADTYARFMRMKGYRVFQPQGFDSFGLPAENYAIKHGIHPAKSTQQNIAKMRNQLKRIGAMYDWDYEVVTSSPEYYKWTQWIFLTLFKMGLAEQRTAPVNWCTGCKTVLANEQVKLGECERCGSGVTKKNLNQWFFNITKYSEELLEKLEILDWPEKTKTMQRHWIGKSIGASIRFQLVDFPNKIEVFTTRPETIYGATYIVLAPEHKLVKKITTIDQNTLVKSYVSQTMNKTEIERTGLDKEKTGVFTGTYALNPMTKEQIPIWISDYVVVSYGTGAIMAVPSGDERDFEFAQKFDLPILEVISPTGDKKGNDICYSGQGFLVNSGNFNGMETSKAFNVICDYLSGHGYGEAKTQYKLHDWLISRQRYWGTPIPVIHCETCGVVAVPEKELPVLLPIDIDLAATYGDDISPLATHENFINTKCPECNLDAKRDPDTMDTFVCSSWYYLRYPDAKEKNMAFRKENLDWQPVDQYIGGSEHATMHLLYARFVTKALRDGGYLNFDEPFLRLYHQGTITNAGYKMSKSKGNTVSPDEFVDKYGSDTFRAFLMFMGPYDEGGDWNDKGITGIHRFLNKAWRLCNLKNSEIELTSKEDKILHYSIKTVGSDLKKKKFNTAISRLMEFVNEFTGAVEINRELKLTFIKIIAPFAPHLAEELWQLNGKSLSVFDTEWPKYNENKIQVSETRYAIQVNGKLRGDILVEKSIAKVDLLIKAKGVENVQKFINGKSIVKEIVVPDRLINFVVN